ncbi:MAG TPA: hypothetical protein DCM45_05605, partial [Clostridiales bacterium]|nr:hypothetical protein [Clostridiales bacterium]
SFGLFDMGSFRINGDELTVTHAGNKSATFKISDQGKKLTLINSSLGYTQTGMVYQYRPQAEYLKAFKKIDGKKLTIDILRDLANDAENLKFTDFAQYACVEIDPDQHVFDIDGEYTLNLLFSADDQLNITVQRNSSGEKFPLQLNGSTGLVFDEFLGLITIPEYQARQWLDYLWDDNLPWGESIDLSVPEFSGVALTWTSEKVTANGQDLIWGMPVWNVYLTDLTNDGKPEICATISVGSGISDTRVIVYDFMKNKEYQLASRMRHDYFLSMQDGKVMVTQTAYSSQTPLVTGELLLINGEICGFGD